MGRPARVEKLEGLISRLHALPRRRLTLLVGIDGSPGAGKTTLARSLAGLDEAIEVVGLDDFPPAEAALPDAPAETAVDWRLFRTQVLLLLSRDLPGLVPPGREVPVGGIVLVEGRGALIKQLATFYDFRVWVDAPDQVRRARLGGAGPVDPARADRAAAAQLWIDGSAEIDPRTQFVRLARPPGRRS